MRRYAVLYVGLASTMLVVFLVCHALAVPWITDSQTVRGLTGVLAGLAGVALLLVDIVLPVPSSVVMIMHGAVFGVPLGMLLSMAGSLGTFAIGFALGRAGLPVVAKIVPDGERAEADSFLQRWGVVAIILSRPVPIVAETVSLTAGASTLGWQPALAAAARSG